MNKKQQNLDQFFNEPLKFIGLCWPGMKLTDYQQNILAAVPNCVETFVHAANGVGKTRTAALVAIWFYLTRTPARVVITSSSENQLTKILWKEILMLINSSSIRLPVTIQKLEIKKDIGSDIDQRDSFSGVVVKSVESFQGLHLPNDKPRTLVVIDEASGVPDEIYEAGQSWATKIFVIGNPMNNHGFFYRQCKAGNQPDPAKRYRELRRVFHISAFDSPNVKLGQLLACQGITDAPTRIMDGVMDYEKLLRLEKSLDEHSRTIRILGQFYEGELARMFPDSWLDTAMSSENWREFANVERRARSMGIDVASGGRDKTCWTIIDDLGVIEQYVEDIEDSMKIAGQTIELIREFHLSSNTVLIDIGGGGKQIADRLCEQGYFIEPVHFGSSPKSNGTYFNRRAELYGELRNRLKPTDGQPPFLLPSDGVD